ncbi:hypothetical protein Daus18300_012549 [Diaporthe australafricana]|uniref:SET domain-containing protein n=1 Tax=Diaporthe australafricana TaxID=127596 RepID=A0ABR3W2B2_9PEZI
MPSPHDVPQVATADVDQQKAQQEEIKQFEGPKLHTAMKRSREEIEEVFAAVASFASQNELPAQNEPLVRTRIGDAYPPCVVPLSSLEKMSLRDLSPGTHHGGRVLIAKTFCEPAKTLCEPVWWASIANAIEDENGDADLVAIYHIPRSVSIGKVLSKGAIIAVKEPYYKFTTNAGPHIRIDHPSDLVFLNSDDNLVPSSFAPVSKDDSTPEAMKENGNAAFKQRDWKAAVDCYSAALALKHDNQDLRRALHRNRSQARINLGHYEPALQDAIAAIASGDALSEETKSQNLKSLYRAGRAAYELGEFIMAKTFFGRALKYSPKDQSALAELRRTHERLEEQRTGKFDFTAMLESVSKGRKFLDHASFLSNAKVAPAGHRGRGLFATTNVAPGDVIMVEKAFCAVFKQEDEKEIHKYHRAECVYGVMDKMRYNPKQAIRYLDWYDGGQFQNKVFDFVDGMCTLDTFVVQATYDINAFGCTMESSRPGVATAKDETHAAGIWLHAAYTNHACIPNAHTSYIGDMMIIRAIRGVKAGEEITVAYQQPDFSYPERKKALSHYGLECDCQLCMTEKAMPNDVLENRSKLVEEIRHLFNANQAITAKISKKLLSRLEDTYPEALYKQLPRFVCCVPLSLLLALDLHEPAQALKHAPQILRCFGYIVEIKGTSVTIDRSSAAVRFETMEAAMVASFACFGSGPEASMQLRDLAKELYKILNACLDGFEQWARRIADS